MLVTNPNQFILGVEVNSEGIVGDHNAVTVIRGHFSVVNSCLRLFELLLLGIFFQGIDRLETRIQRSFVLIDLDSVCIKSKN